MQKAAHILLVEDEESLAKTLALNLELENYVVSTASNGNAALEAFKQNNPPTDLVLLDVMMPDMDGFELCTRFKALKPEVPVIFLTAKYQSSDKIKGLKLGADDYITKPFDLEEVLLRISNLLKRIQKPVDPVFSFGKCRIDFKTFTIVDIAGEEQSLTKREIGLLELLTQNENKVISRDEIIDKLWNINENASSRTIDNYILNFRKHFELNPKDPQHFLSIRGVGYKFIA